MKKYGMKRKQTLLGSSRLCVCLFVCARTAESTDQNCFAAAPLTAVITKQDISDCVEVSAAQRALSETALICCDVIVNS